MTKDARIPRFPSAPPWLCAVAMIAAALYFGGHLLAYWLR